MSRLPPRPALFLLPALLALLAACGGGAPPAAPEALAPPGTVVFKDGFEDPLASADQWTPEETALEVDGATGTLALDDGVLTTNAPPFERAGGQLDLRVSMAWPAWCPTGGPHTSRPIELVELATGDVLASLVITTSADCSTLVAEYRVDPTGEVSPASVANPVSTNPFLFADGLHDYRIVLLEDGRATWYRDGTAMITSLVPISDGGYALRVSGVGIAGTQPAVFDEVEVVQR